MHSAIRYYADRFSSFSLSSKVPKSELDTLSLSHPPLKNTQDIYRYIDSNEKNFSIDRYKDIVNF